MNINELLETIKDTSRDYIGVRGYENDILCQDLTREELDLIVNEIERLNNIINETQKIIFNNAFKFDKWVENENGKCILSQSSYIIKDLLGDKVREIWDILNKS